LWPFILYLVLNIKKLVKPVSVPNSKVKSMFQIETSLFNLVNTRKEK
jgi:hypothetical protein